MTLFDPGPPPQGPVVSVDPRIDRPHRACKHCGIVTHWLWSPVALVWLCNSYTPGAKGCGLGQGTETVERVATPAEVDAGCELGIAYDTVPVGGWPRAKGT